MTDFWNRHRDTDVIEVTVRRVEGSALRVRETLCADLKTVRAALSRPAGDEGVRDTARLDWLDAVNRRTNERNGNRYGWRYDINHNRAALTDHNWPPLSVREAIDAAMDAANQSSTERSKA